MGIAHVQLQVTSEEIMECLHRTGAGLTDCRDGIRIQKMKSALQESESVTDLKVILAELIDFVNSRR